MSIPTKMKNTPAATVTVAEGQATDTSSEFWQRVAGNVFRVYGGVPYSLGQRILQSNQPDTAIQLMLSSYPQRIASV